MAEVSAKLLRRVPMKCPSCDYVATCWSPLRVRCPICDFQMKAKPGESSAQLVARWNRAVGDGEGYVELLQENQVRKQRRRWMMEEDI